MVGLAQDTGQGKGLREQATWENPDQGPSPNQQHLGDGGDGPPALPLSAALCVPAHTSRSGVHPVVPLRRWGLLPAQRTLGQRRDGHAPGPSGRLACRGDKMFLLSSVNKPEVL